MGALPDHKPLSPATGTPDVTLKKGAAHESSTGLFLVPRAVNPPDRHALPGNWAKVIGDPRLWRELRDVLLSGDVDDV